MTRVVYLWVIVGWVLAVSCAPQTPRVSLHLQRPVDMAFVCTVGGKAAPLTDCKAGAGTLRGFIVNAEKGNVGVLDLRSRDFVDTNAFIPGITPSPVGLRPVAIISTADGKALFIANAAAQSLSRLDTVTMAYSEQPLPGTPADVVEAGDELLVAVPDQGRLIRIPKDAFGGLTTFESISLPAGSPIDVAVNSEATLAYVGHATAPWLSVVDLQAGAEIHQIEISSQCGPDPATDSCDKSPLPEAIALDSDAIADLPQCANGVDDDGDGRIDFAEDPQCLAVTGALEGSSLPPILARVALAPTDDLVYVLNARDRVVVVVDVVAAKRVNVNDPGALGANALYRRLGYQDIVLKNSPLDLALVQVDVPDAGNVLQSRLRAYVSDVTGQVSVIEVENAAGERVHHLFDASSKTTSRLEQPQLFDGDVELELSSNRRSDRPSFGEFVVDKPVDILDPSAGVTHYGIRLLGNERLELREVWNVTHQGGIVRETRRLGKVESDGVFVTPGPQFCDRGVEVGDLLVINFPQDYKISGCEGYRGKAFSWAIESVSQQRLKVADDGAVLEATPGQADVGSSVGGLTIDCFGSKALGEHLRYEIRAPAGQYTVVGSTSGFLHPWIAQADGSCLKDPDADPRFVSRVTEWTAQVETLPFGSCPPNDVDATTLFAGTYFHNHAFEFRILPGCTTDDLTGDIEIVETAPNTQWRFVVDSAFVPKRLVGMGIPVSVRFLPIDKVVYVVDSGQEKIVEIQAGSDTIRSTVF